MRASTKSDGVQTAKRFPAKTNNTSGRLNEWAHVCVCVYEYSGLISGGGGGGGGGRGQWRWIS